MSPDATNPYVGLRPFDVDESLLFFGRNDQTLELLQRLHKHHFVAVVGSSGCGKSSLLRAGLIPALKAGYLVDDSDNWFIAIMKPGQNPLYNLAESILLQINPQSDSVAVSALVQKIEEEGADVILNVHFKNTGKKKTSISFYLSISLKSCFVLLWIRKTLPKRMKQLIL
jgi:ABC-type glutathione transport system ATPase component